MGLEKNVQRLPKKERHTACLLWNVDLSASLDLDV